MRLLFAAPPSGMETSASKYFLEIFARVPSAFRAARAVSACLRSAGSVLRNVNACLLTSSPASPVILIFFEPVELR